MASKHDDSLKVGIEIMFSGETVLFSIYKFSISRIVWRILAGYSAGRSEIFRKVFDIFVKNGIGVTS
jgi:hypothetical protein